MHVTHLPAEAVALLNALGRADAQDDEIEAARVAFAALREHVDHWLRFHGAYTLHDGEAAMLANLTVLWSEIDRAVDEAAVERLASSLYEAVQTMDAVLAERQRPHFSLQPAVNDFVMAAASVMLGRGGWRAIDERLPVVACWLDNLVSLYDGAAARLRPQVAAELERGRAALTGALSRARDAARERDTEALREATFRLQGAASVVQQFVEWTKRDDARLAERYTRFRIPLDGPTLEHCLEAARRMPRSAWSVPLDHVERVVLPRLVTSWTHARGRALLPWRVREARLAAVDTSLETLVMAIGGLRDASSPRREALDAVEAALETLSRAFEAVDRDALRREAVRGTAADEWYELLAGALTGTVPDIALPRALRQAAPPRCVVEGVVRWLATRAPEALSDALERLVEEAPAREQPAVEETWTCSCCGAENAQGEGACGRCRRRPETLMTASWDG